MEKNNLIDFIGDDCWNIILDMKAQIEHSERMVKVMKQLKNEYKYQYTEFVIGGLWLCIKYDNTITALCEYK